VAHNFDWEAALVLSNGAVEVEKGRRDAAVRLADRRDEAEIILEVEVEADADEAGT
jgi:hypothetical protein